MARAVPEWIITNDLTGDPAGDPAAVVTDVDLGVLKTGKEAEISLVERTAGDGRRCLLARKRYRPRSISHKGELRELGFERAPTFRNDLEYRDGRNYGRRSRDRRAVETMTNYGRELVKERWHGHEHATMRRLWDAGATVPYPVSFGEDGMLMQYLGTDEGAAPRLAQARLSVAERARAWDQTEANMRLLAGVGIVHADLSAYNLLWWQDEAWMIDFPQSVDLFHNPHGFEFLHRDVLNVARWFSRRGVDVDAEAVFADLVAVAC